MNLVWANTCRALGVLLSVYTWIIVADALLSWFMSPDHKVKQFIGRLTAPVLQPFRAVTARLQGRLPIDLAPLLAIVTLGIVEEVFNVIANQLMRM